MKIWKFGNGNGKGRALVFVPRFGRLGREMDGEKTCWDGWLVGKGAGTELDF
jgi:hypothetical protein